MTITELLESVRRVEVRTNRLVNDTMVGAYLSHFKGRGMDFEELREYIPGDDVRDIDWNVTHRLGRPFVKRFREERELTVVLAVDISASSSFGSANRSKREYAAEVAATLAMSAAKNGDKVALMLFTDEVELYVPPRKGRRHILRLVRELLMFQPKKRGTDISRSLVFLNHVLHRRAIVFLLTDFLHSGAPNQSRAPQSRDVVAELGLSNTRHDIICLHLHDPRESELPDAGLVTIEDAETGELLELDSARSGVRERFAKINAERLAELDRALNRTGVDTLRLQTTEPFAPVLQRFFEIRRGTAARIRAWMNLQPSTFNAERSMAALADIRLGRWALKVGGSAFLFLTAVTLPLGAESTSSTKDLPSLAPAYGELPATFWEQHEAPILVTGFACLAFACLFLKVWLRPKSPPVLVPETIARQELAALKDRFEDGMLLSEVSQIMRRYTAAAFGLTPVEMTTTEFCAALSANEKNGPELAGLISSFLRECDALKFAPAGVGATFNAINRALELVSLAEKRRAFINPAAGRSSE